MILLIPMSGKEHVPANFPKPLEVEHIVTSMATAMSNEDHSAFLVDETKLKEWLPVFELVDPAPILVTSIPDTVTPPVWTTVATTLVRRDAMTIDEELKVAREQSTTKSKPVDANDSRAMSLRAGGGLNREATLDVVDVTSVDEEDGDA